MTGRQIALGLTALFVLSTVSGWSFQTVGAPLPWMIGPLISTALVFMIASPPLTVPDKMRPAGQIVVATQVGTAFSPAALIMLIQSTPVIVGTVLVTIGCIFATAWIVARLARQPLAQAFLSAAPTSPVEAAAMARAAGLDPVPIILSQAIRLGAVVIIVPFLLYAIDGWPEDRRPPVAFALADPMPIVALACIGAIAAIAFKRLRVPNPNFLGPMTLAAVLSASGSLSWSYPPLVLAAAQIVLGTWLGANFRRELVASALRLAAVSLGSALLLLTLCSLSAVGIAHVSGLDWRTLVLGAAPGGAVEMALTAKFLHQNVVLITTFHLARIFIFMPNIPWIVRRLAGHDAKKGFPT